MNTAVRIAIALAWLLPCSAFADNAIVVGSKAFTEGFVLGEIAAQSIESASTVRVERKLGMGNTGIRIRGAAQRRHRCVS